MTGNYHGPRSHAATQPQQIHRFQEDQMLEKAKSQPVNIYGAPYRNSLHH
jgi:hypothetical protein